MSTYCRKLQHLVIAQQLLKSYIFLMVQSEAEDAHIQTSQIATFIARRDYVRMPRQKLTTIIEQIVEKAGGILECARIAKSHRLRGF